MKKGLKMKKKQYEQFKEAVATTKLSKDTKYRFQGVGVFNSQGKFQGLLSVNELFSKYINYHSYLNRYPHANIFFIYNKQVDSKGVSVMVTYNKQHIMINDYYFDTVIEYLYKLNKNIFLSDICKMKKLINEINRRFKRHNLNVAFVNVKQKNINAKKQFAIIKAFDNSQTEVDLFYPKQVKTQRVKLKNLDINKFELLNNNGIRLITNQHQINNTNDMAVIILPATKINNSLFNIYDTCYNTKQLQQILFNLPLYAKVVDLETKQHKLLPLSDKEKDFLFLINQKKFLIQQLIALYFKKSNIFSIDKKDCTIGINTQRRFKQVFVFDTKKQTLHSYLINNSILRYTIFNRKKHSCRLSFNQLLSDAIDKTNNRKPYMYSYQDNLITIFENNYNNAKNIENIKTKIIQSIKNNDFYNLTERK